MALFNRNYSEKNYSVQDICKKLIDDIMFKYHFFNFTGNLETIERRKKTTQTLALLDILDLLFISSRNKSTHKVSFIAH